MNQTLRSFSLALPVFGGEEGGLPATGCRPATNLSPLWLNALRSLVLAARFEQLIFAFIQFVATPLIQCSHGYTLRGGFQGCLRRASQPRLRSPSCLGVVIKAFRSSGSFKVSLRRCLLPAPLALQTLAAPIDHNETDYREQGVCPGEGLWTDPKGMRTKANVWRPWTPHPVAERPSGLCWNRLRRRLLFAPAREAPEGSGHGRSQQEAEGFAGAMASRNLTSRRPGASVVQKAQTWGMSTPRPAHYRRGKQQRHPPHPRPNPLRRPS